MNTEAPHTETMIPLQKHLFDIPSEITYLNCCYMSPQLLSVSEAGRQALFRKLRPWIVRIPDFFEETEKSRHKIAFDNLTPLYPNKQLVMEVESTKTSKNIDLTPRLIDLVSPIGKGQRSLIISPPKAGKTMILQSIANSITANHPECFLMVF